MLSRLTVEVQGRHDELLFIILPRNGKRERLLVEVDLLPEFVALLPGLLELVVRLLESERHLAVLVNELFLFPLDMLELPPCLLLSALNPPSFLGVYIRSLKELYLLHKVGESLLQMGVLLVELHEGHFNCRGKGTQSVNCVIFGGVAQLEFGRGVSNQLGELARHISCQLCRLHQNLLQLLTF